MKGKKKAKSKSNNTSIPNQDIIESTVATKARVDVDERNKRATSPSPSRFPSQTNSSEIAPRQFMHWDTADLLSLHSILSVCRPASYFLIIEKSCSDSIACAEDIFVSIPYPLTFVSPPLPPFPRNPLNPIPIHPLPIHPLHILALHLALVTQPGGR